MVVVCRDAVDDIGCARPVEVGNKLTDALQKILTTDAAREFARKTWTEFMLLPPATMRKFQGEEMDRFRRIAEAGGQK